MSDQLTVLVCGGRDFDDHVLIDAELRKLKPTRVVAGCALGADLLALSWAERSGVEWKKYYAVWVAHGRAAGPIRNQAMLDSERIDVVLAFPGGRGTADMVKRAKAKGLDVRIVQGGGS